LEFTLTQSSHSPKTLAEANAKAGKKARKKARAQLASLFAEHVASIGNDSGEIDWDDTDDGMALLAALFQSDDISDSEAVAVLDLLVEEHGLNDDYANCIAHTASNGDDEMWDPEAFAMLFQKEKCMFWLIDHCAGHPDSTTPWGEPLLFFAPIGCANGLLDRGASPTTTNDSGRTLFHVLARPEWAHIDLAHRLLELDVPVNNKDSDGATALHVAAAHGNTAAAQWLLENGADFTLLAKKKTAFQIALDKGNTAVAELLQARETAQKEESALQSELEKDTKKLNKLGRMVSLWAREGRLSLDGQVLTEDALATLARDTAQSLKKKARI